MSHDTFRALSSAEELSGKIQAALIQVRAGLCIGRPRFHRGLDMDNSGSCWDAPLLRRCRAAALSFLFVDDCFH
jgi:hypothetical protein